MIMRARMPGFTPLRLLLILTVATLLVACSSSRPAVDFHAKNDPVDLSAWHVVDIHDGYLALNKGVVPYDVNTKLFSDYAYKLRTVWMPKGKTATYKATGVLGFPDGTIISKTFYYPIPKGQPRNATDVVKTYRELGDFTPGKGLKLAHVHLVETRLLLKRQGEWQAITYTWNAQQTRATLAPDGALDDLVFVGPNHEREKFTYVVPSHDQCEVCHNYVIHANENHSPAIVLPIGPTAGHLNKPFSYAHGTENQLTHWAKVGYLKGVPPAVATLPHSVAWEDTKLPLDARARSYLDANCAYCHNPHGEANYTNLWLDIGQAEGIHTGFCKTPVAAGRATGGNLYDVVPGNPDKSILTYRMASTEVGVMMPELGRTTYDRKGVALIRKWIASLPGDCQILHGPAANAAP